MKAETKKLEVQARRQKKENALRSRLITKDERAQLIQRLKTETMTNAQRLEIEKRIKDSNLEERGRKEQLKKQGKYVIPKDNVTNLKSVFERGVTVKKTEDIAGGLAQTYILLFPEIQR